MKGNSRKFKLFWGVLGLVLCMTAMSAMAASEADRVESDNEEAVRVEAEETANTVDATNDIAKGTGWKLDGNGCLHITGAVNTTKNAWRSYCFNIKSVVTTEGASVNDCKDLFYNCMYLTSADLTYLDTSSVTDMTSMFGNCEKLTTLVLGTMDTSKVTNMSYAFWNCSSLESLDISGFNTSEVLSMEGMFEGDYSLTTLNLGNIDTGKVTNMSCMFSRCSELPSLDVSHLNTVSVVDFSSMFSDCEKVTALDVSGFKTEKATMMLNMFLDCYALKTLNVDNFVTTQVTTMVCMFAGCRSLTALDISKLDTSAVTNLQGMFCDCQSLTTLNLGNPNTSQVTDMSKLFSYCGKLKSIDVSQLETDSLTNTACMFESCASLESLDISHFNMSKVTDMGNMFWNCAALKTLKVDNWITSSATNMGGLFRDCSALEYLNPSNFDTSSVTSISYMFANCSSLKTLDLSSFDTSSVIWIGNMFENCSSLKTLDLSNFVTSEAKGFNSFLAGCSSLEKLDIGSFDCSKAQYLIDMLYGCGNLGELRVSANAVSVLADDLIDIAAPWTDKSNGNIYSDSDELKTITKTVTLINKNYHPVIENRTNAWYGVTVKWTPIKGYTAYVYRQANGTEGSVTLLTQTTAGGYYDQTAENNVMYSYRVDLVRNDETLSGIETAFESYMASPTIQSVTNVSGGAKVTWTAVNGADGYFVYRKDTQEGTWHMIGSTQKNLYYTDTTVENGVVYYYAIKSFTVVDGERVFSASSSAKNTVYVQNNYIKQLSNKYTGILKVEFSLSPKCTGYEIVYGTTSDLSDGLPVQIKMAGATDKSITGLKKGTTYYVKIRAYKTVGGYTFYSNWSATKSLTMTK